MLGIQPKLVREKTENKLQIKFTKDYGKSLILDLIHVLKKNICFICFF